MNIVLNLLLGLTTAGLLKTEIFVSNDFENGTVSQWFAQSPARVASSEPNSTELFASVLSTTTGPGSCEPSFHYGGGYISLPDFPNDYPNNADCFWFLDTRGYGIYLEFTSFSTEECCDFLKVYGDWSTDGTPLLQASGSSIPGPVYTDMTNRMLVHFNSDGSSTSTGFEAYFRAYHDLGTETTTSWQTTPPYSCGGTLTGNSGTVSSPNYPGHYFNSMDCSTWIRVDPGYRIRIAFNEFQTEDQADFLTIYDGPTASSAQLLKASGSVLPSALTSTSNEIYVHFTSDSTGNTYMGWHFYYSTNNGTLYDYIEHQ